MQFGQIVFHDVAHEVHQQADLAPRSPPVLGTEGKQRQVPHARIGARFGGTAQNLGTRSVARGTRQAPLARPAMIAVHDDRNVGRYPCVIRSFRERGRSLLFLGHTDRYRFRFP